jgi:prephenate dehydrogenase
MKLGYIGLGKMGFNMVELLLEKDHQVVVFDRNSEAVSAIAAKGAVLAGSLAVMAQGLQAPRLFWIMVPYAAVDDVLQELMPFLKKGDTVPPFFKFKTCTNLFAYFASLREKALFCSGLLSLPQGGVTYETR